VLTRITGQKRNPGKSKKDLFGTCQQGRHSNTKKNSENRFLYRPPPLHNGIVTLFLDLDFNFGILVRYFEYPEFLGIDQPLQGKHVGPVHAFEIVTFIKHFPHDFHSLLAIDGQSTRVLINLMRFRVLTASNRPDTEFIAFLAFLWESLNIVARHNPI
jgi:hypothetical protein